MKKKKSKKKKKRKKKEKSNSCQKLHLVFNKFQPLHEKRKHLIHIKLP